MHMKLKKITLASGEAIEVVDGLTAIVGPNNAGKSRLLREFHQRLTSGAGQHFNPPHQVFGTHEIEYGGTVDDLIDEFRRRGYELPAGSYPEGYFSQSRYRIPTGSSFQADELRALWGSQDGLASFGNYFALYLGAEGRLGMTGNGGGFNPLKQAPAGAAQMMFADRAMEANISAALERAFNEPLLVNRYAATEIPLHIGRMTIEETKPPASQEYLQEISALPLLQEQGDGMRAFAGMLLTIISGQNPLVIIDEPEAFLHPPQAYLLGKVLAEQHDNGTQVVVATHDANFIAGVTSAKAASGNVSIARLTRRGVTNHVAPLSSSVVSELYKDPLLKYYPILDGLFAQGVVLCEGDSDCIYYRAVLDNIPKLDDGTEVSSLSIHFAHCGGKARVARAAAALRSAMVPVACVLDIDLLQNEHEFNGLIEALKGDPEEYTPLRNTIVNMVESGKTTISRASAKAEIDAVLTRKNTSELSNSEAARIRDLVTPKSGWSEFKKFGRGKLLGSALTAFDELDEKLRAIGVHLVPGGELESFHPAVSRDDKAAWLRDVLEKERYKAADESSKFVQRLAQAIATAG